MPRLPSPRQGRVLPTPATGFPVFYRGKRKPRMIAADPWACLTFLAEETYRLPKETKRQVLAYLDQGHQFFASGQETLHRTRALLYYYSFLNVAKALLLMNGINLHPITRHGLVDPRANARVRLRLEGQQVTAADPTATKQSETFPLLAQALGATTPLPRTYKVLDLMGQVPAVHRTYTMLRGTEPAFCPITNIDLLSAGGEVWSRVRLAASAGDVVKTLPRLRKNRDFQELFKVVSSEEEREIWLESDPEPGRTRAIDTAIHKMSARFKKVGVWSILSRSGYSHYLSPVPPKARLPQLCSIYAVMFYLGSVVRYKPYDYDRMASARYGWLISEFLSSQPTQFIYLAASELAGVDVVKPYAE